MKIKEIETILELIVVYLRLMEVNNDDAVELRQKILNLMDGLVFDEFE
jgi:hypothetical protein